MNKYLITEPYDGSRVRVLVEGDTPEHADRIWRAVAEKRVNQGYTFFEPLRRVIGDPREVENELDRIVADLPEWDYSPPDPFGFGFVDE